ncbi:MAG: hypothetical protein A2474_01780 [Elusimicrobia bacterium RIFOXYC2_FULL_34_12]|nr:MAG: hypothetical protein A2474_01780 [Elusimicrobia bacterium RIFOXYC2_FULL_34_12]OGS39035.1 MAG: hypothetical protein A2551_07380 [Elusimicrobia bacterium RIFOXYD2_FULL_34_30]HAM39698.1 4Fe-4S ferredoxin [Elusimicrobiota bacterium]
MEKSSVKKEKPEVYFASTAVECLEGEATLPAKFKRMLKKFNLPKRVGNKKVVIKMHFGQELGYTTIHPFFVRLLVQAVKDAGAKSVKIMDGDAKSAVARGYTLEVIGCPVVSCFGKDGKYLYTEKIGFKNLDEVYFSGEAVDAEFFIDLSHLKGHGDCGFGGALKNIAMGIVPNESRRRLHSLEGGLIVDKGKCIFCLKCFKACKNGAIKADKTKREIGFFFHNCTYCQHCLMVCPEKAIKMEDRTFENFSEGMAIVTSKFLQKFKPENLLFINFLMNITIYCDCWGFSTASLVPDIGILGSDDIGAIDTASLDMVKTENLLVNGLPKGRKLLSKGRHLFERIHGKDPYLMLKYLEKYYNCSMNYKLEEIK